MNDVFQELEKMLFGGLRYLEDKIPSSFLPYTIKCKDDVAILSMAVAGYPLSNLTVTHSEGIVTIEGTSPAKEEETSDWNTIYRGLALRDFKVRFPFPQVWLVDSVELKDGLLTITLKKKAASVKALTIKAA